MFMVKQETENDAYAYNDLSRSRSLRWRKPTACALLLLLAFYLLLPPMHLSLHPNWPVGKQPKDDLHTCAWRHLSQSVSLLEIPAITKSTFLERQKRLAAALDRAGIDAFVAEPSAATAYYFNISANYERSERPFLLSLSRDAQVSFLAPRFELGRIQELPLVAEEAHIYSWSEEDSPYAVFKHEIPYDSIMLDEASRYMIAAGLMNAGLDVFPATTEMNALRAVKAQAELDILKGINTFTLRLIQALQPCLHVGMTQGQVADAVEGLFRAAGVGQGVWSIVLFGDAAASPHGGSGGRERVLQEGEFVLLDIGSSLHGYGSDVTRTILPTRGKVSKKKMGAWQAVHEAQAAAFGKMVQGTACAEVDQAARDVLHKAGLGEFFTHRLGHGLGLEMHEHPYLNGANTDEQLLTGEVATNEPGVYVVGEYGVRLEDAVVVGEQAGWLLTGSRAESPWKP